MWAPERRMWPSEAGFYSEGRMWPPMWPPERRMWPSEGRMWAPECRIWAPERRMWAPERRMWPPERRMWPPEHRMWPPEGPMRPPERQMCPDVAAEPGFARKFVFSTIAIVLQYYRYSIGGSCVLYWYLSVAPRQYTDS